MNLASLSMSSNGSNSIDVSPPRLFLGSLYANQGPFFLKFSLAKLGLAQYLMSLSSPSLYHDSMQRNAVYLSA